MARGCMSCKWHGPPVAPRPPGDRPCQECIKTGGFLKWEPVAEKKKKMPVRRQIPNTLSEAYNRKYL